MSEGMPRGKTAGELRAEYERIWALADQDVRDLNAGRVPAPQVRCSAWMEELAKTWERNADEIEHRCNNPERATGLRLAAASLRGEYRSKCEGSSID